MIITIFAFVIYKLWSLKLRLKELKISSLISLRLAISLLITLVTNTITLMRLRIQISPGTFLSAICKKVYITPSFISIERFNIVEWGDVEEEVKNLIENYLNSGQEVISNIKEKKQSNFYIYRKYT